MLWQVESYAEGNINIKSTPQDRQETTKGELSNCRVELTISDCVFNLFYANVWIESGIFSAFFTYFISLR